MIGYYLKEVIKVAYNVRRNSVSGYVALYNVSRVKGTKNKQRVLYVAGFGIMNKAEFAKFKKYAHSITPQEKRLKILLSDSRCVESQKEIPKKSILKAEPKRKVQARRGFKAPKQTQEDIKEDVARYKRNIERERREKESTMTHTERMMQKREGRRHAQIKTKHGMDLTHFKTNNARRNAIDDRIREIDKYISYTDHNIKASSQKFSISKHRLPEYQANRSSAIEAKEILKEQRKGLKA